MLTHLTLCRPRKENCSPRWVYLADLLYYAKFETTFNRPEYSKSNTHLSNLKEISEYILNLLIWNKICCELLRMLFANSDQQEMLIEILT